MAFIERVALSSRASRVLDLGCGPGFYARMLAEHGHDVTGIDFSPASIDYAREQAAARSLSCRFELGDVRSAEYGDGYDLVTLLYGELNLFERHEAIALLKRCVASLAPGGMLLLEVHGYDAVRNRGQAAPRWQVVPSGLFSDEPHLRCDQGFWSEAGSIASGRHWIVDAASSEVTMYGWSMLAYDDAAYESLLADAGLRIEARFDSLTGDPDAGDFPVLLVGTGA
jgi:SAM-dependent methyltransferase